MRKLSGNLDKVNCIFVDEAQFLTPSQVDEFWIVSKVMDIPVICYGLRNNFMTESFDGSRRLLEISDVLEELTTLCGCGQIARYVGRKRNGEFETTGKEVVIDGTDNIEYVPLCGDCYLKKVKNQDCFSWNLSRADWKLLWKKDKKKCLVAYLFETQKYLMLLALSKAYHKRIVKQEGKRV